MNMRRFQYRLQALETLSTFRLETRRLELAQALRASEACVEEVRKLTDTGNSVAAAWRQETGQHGIDPGRHATAMAYLGDLQDRLRAAHQRQRLADAAYEEALTALGRAQMRVERVSRHKAEAQRRHAEEARVLAQNEADADWIMRQGSAG